ncbi:hypothetical protein F5141DRAFT_1129888 [Pisolithus sp. B1]|nr:hypothetical protein F5141DRAFT_1129888 [Pisolithus sp. B1]
MLQFDRHARRRVGAVSLTRCRTGRFPIGVACDCILPLGAALLHPQTLTVASVLPRNMSCVSVALLHPCFQVPYRPANIHPSKMVGIADHRGVRPIEFGKVIVNSPNSSSNVRRLSRPHRQFRLLPRDNGHIGTTLTPFTLQLIRQPPVVTAWTDQRDVHQMVMGSESWRCHSRITRVRHVLNHEICLRKAFTPTPRSTCRYNGAQGQSTTCQWVLALRLPRSSEAFSAPH